MKKIMIAIVCVLALGLTAPHARADTLNFYDTYYVGVFCCIEGLPGGSNPSNELFFLDRLLQVSKTAPQPKSDEDLFTPGYSGVLYNRTGGQDGPFPAATSFFGKDEDAPIGPFDVTQATYILGKYDGPGGGYFVWRVDNLPDGFGLVNLPGTAPTGYTGGLSHGTMFGGVPDGGVTLMLLGGALVGLEVLRRRSRA